MSGAAATTEMNTTPKQNSELIESWVDEWQAWLRSVSRARLDYPCHANFLSEHNGCGFSQAPTRNPRAEKMDMAMGGLFKLDRNAHDAFWFKYVEKAGANTTCAKMMGRYGKSVSRKTFEKYLEKGESFILGVFFGKNI